MKDVEYEDRPSVKARLAKESGYTGLSTLFRLYALYGFDVCKDMVFDLMHQILMNVVKKFLDYLVDSGKLNPEEVDARMSNILWNLGNHFLSHIFTAEKFKEYLIKEICGDVYKFFIYIYLVHIHATYK